MSEIDRNSTLGKRKTLKALLGISGTLGGLSVLPDKWSRPVISSVILPAHAEATPSSDGCADSEFNSPAPIFVSDTVTFSLEAEAEFQSGDEVSVDIEVVYDNLEAGVEGVSQEFGTELLALTDGEVTVDLELEGAQFVVTQTELSFELCDQDYNFEANVA